MDIQSNQIVNLPQCRHSLKVTCSIEGTNESMGTAKKYYYFKQEENDDVEIEAANVKDALVIDDLMSVLLF